MATTDMYDYLSSQIELPLRPPEECTILVVDDDERIVEMLVFVLERDGYQIVTARNGYDALKRVEDSAPDVVVLDVLLPGPDGIEVCKRIREDDETRFLPVILVTGDEDRNRRVEGRFAGADEFLNKPFDPLELSVRIRTLLRSKQWHDELEMHRRDLEQLVEQRTHELREANKRLEALSRVKSNVIDLASHELRTPAMQAKMYVDTARETDDPGERAGLFEEADKAFARLIYYLDELRAFSDPTGLKLDYASVSDIVRGAASRVYGLHEKAISLLELNVPRGLPPVYVDVQKMTRVLTHLIDNGVKFGNDQPVEVTVTLANGGDGVAIAVRDYGDGIAPEVLSRLYEPLEQGSGNLLTRQQGGFGIGLAFARMVLDAHGVELMVETELGAGSIFSFVLPRAELVD